jgi:4-amino-4-deoxy-L-arabinose transferase-like glycosyltransferase
MVLVFVTLVIQILLRPPIWHHGEAREGLVVQGIVRDDQWILPLRNGELPSKPPLFHWVAALIALQLGLSDFSVRLTSAIAGEIMAIATFLLGRAMGSRKTAWLAVGALLGMHEFWDSGTQARVDMVFAACVTLAVAGFFFWRRNGSPIGRATCYVASACAVLAKGPIGVAIPGLVVFGFFAAEGRLRSIWTFWSWPLAALVLLFDLGWYGLAYRVAGDEFLRLHILRENVDRFIGSGAFITENTSLPMVGWLATRMLPWNLALPWCLIRRLRGERGDAAGHLLHAWWISIFGLFVLAARARAVYLLPMYPAIALLAARAIAAKIPGSDGASDSEPAQTLPGNARGLRRQTAKGLGMGIALLDLGVMLVNPRTYRDTQPQESRLAFVEKIAAAVPTHRPLFATPEFRGPELIVITYRLGRKIGRKPMTSADRDDYFLSPIESAGPAGTETRVVAVSETDKVALVRIVPRKPDIRR